MFVCTTTKLWNKKATSTLDDMNEKQRGRCKNWEMSNPLTNTTNERIWAAQCAIKRIEVRDQSNESQHSEVGLWVHQSEVIPIGWCQLMPLSTNQSLTPSSGQSANVASLRAPKDVHNIRRKASNPFRWTFFEMHCYRACSPCSRKNNHYSLYWVIVFSFETYFFAE